MQKLRCHFDVIDWKEDKVWQADDGSSLSMVAAQYRYSGDINGDSRSNMELMYHANGASHFVALERIVASVDGKEGGLILRHSGIHENQAATGECEIVHATGELEGMRGAGNYRAESPTVELVLTLTN
jgi:hypothetical protein